MILAFELFPAGSGWAALTGLLFSLLVGSFLNVVILRLPVMMEREWKAAMVAEEQDSARTTTDEEPPFNLATPRSRCGHCGHLITWYENIPVFSYLFLRGRCSSCQTSISARYPLIELLSGLAGAFIAWRYGITPIGVALLLMTWTLIALTFIDIDHHLLPDSLTLPLLWLGLILNSFELITSLSDAVWGAALGYLVLWSVYWLFKLLTGKEGMGYGDFKLLAAFGAWGGVSVLPMVILFSSVAGVILAGLMIAVKRHEAQNPLPFGPYLAIAGWVALLWGQDILNWYLY